MKLIDFLDKNDILYTGIEIEIINDKKVTKNRDIIKCNDYNNPELVKKRNKKLKDTKWIAIYTNKVQQIDIDKDNGFFELNGPWYPSITKNMPHIFVKFGGPKCQYNFADLLTNAWSYALRDSIVHNSEMGIKTIDKKKICDKMKIAKQFEDNLELIPKKLTRKEWFGAINYIYNRAEEIGYNDPVKLVHNFSKSVEGYDSEAIRTINGIVNNRYTNYGKYFIKNLLSIKESSILERKLMEEEEKEKREKRESNEELKQKEKREKRESNEEIVKIKELKQKEKREEIKNDYPDFKKTLEKYVCFIREINKVICVSSNNIMPMTIKEGKTVRKDFLEVPELRSCILHKNSLSLFKLWEEDPDKKYHDRIDFIPTGYIVKENIYNLWSGYTHEKEDIVLPRKSTITTFEKFINHLANGDKSLKEFMIYYLSNVIQNPGIKEGILLIFASTQGSGKGTLMRLLKKLINTEYIEETAQADKILGRFNVNLRTCLIANINEAITYKMIECDGLIKSIVSDYDMKYEQKGLSSQSGHNFTRLIITTNEEIGAKATLEDRRNVYINSPKMPNELITEINNLIDDEILVKEIFWYLKSIEIIYKNMYDWQTNRPITEQHKEVVEVSLDPIYDFLTELEQEINSSADLYMFYRNYMAASGYNHTKNKKSFYLKIGKIYKEINNDKIMEKLNKPVKGYYINKKLLIKNFIKAGILNN